MVDMKRLLTTVAVFLGLTSLSFSQVITLPKLTSYLDTGKYYYLSTCEEYKDLFRRSWRYDYRDTCNIDFTKYDIEGIREADTLQWKLVQPKKYIELKYQDLPAFDTLKWKVYIENMIVTDTVAFNKVKNNVTTLIKDTFDFNTTALIYNYVFIDCHGSFYYKILYDECENKIVCYLIEVSGGCHGMKSEESWIMITKPNPSTIIELKELLI